MRRNLFIVICLFSIISLKSQNSSSLNLEWKSRGPFNVSGITRAILWDKDDENIMYSGGIASGLYKSTNKGSSWFKVESYIDNNPSISSIAQNPNGILFVGTGYNGGAGTNGLLNYFSMKGSGVYKSDDDGNTWSQIDETIPDSIITNSEWNSVTTIATNPLNSNLIMLGNLSGVRISGNAEDTQPTFQDAQGISGLVTDLKFTSDGLDAWATANGEVYYSDDASNNFLNFSLRSPANANRAQIALSYVDASSNYIVYASFTNASGCLQGIYKSTDRGTTWTQIGFSGGVDPFQLPNYGCQGWYSHTLAVNPADKNIIYIGSVTLNTITSAGDLIQIDDINNENANEYLPSYKHTIVFNPNNANEMLVGTEEGIFLSENALDGYPNNISYASKTKGLNNGISLNADISKDGKILFGGYLSTFYLDYSLSSPYDAKKIWNRGNATYEISNYEEGVFIFSGTEGYLRKSENSGISNYPFLDSNIDPAGCDFITCDYLAPGTSCGDISAGIGFFNENYLYESDTKAKFFVPTVCNNKFFVSTNPTDLNASPIYSSFYINFSSGIRTMDVSTDGDRLVFGSGSHVGVIDGFDSFIPDNTITNNSQININNYDLSNIGISSIAGISIDKNDKNHILVCEDGYGNSKVAKTYDGGLTWTIIHNNLPNIPIFDCIIDANNFANYIVATQEGIWTSNDTGLSWQQDNSGMGKLPIFRIRQEWVLEEDCYVLLAATFGNGIYTSTSLTNCNKDVEEEIWGTFNPIADINNDEFSINVYPNPAQSNFIIKLTEPFENTETITIYNVVGKQIYSNNIKSSLEIETTNWTSGVYYVSIKNTTKKVVILK